MILYKVYRVCVLLSIYNLLSNVKSAASIHSKLKLRFYGISYFIVNWDAIHLNPKWVTSQGPVAHLSANHITPQIASPWKSADWKPYLRPRKVVWMAEHFIWTNVRLFSFSHGVQGVHKSDIAGRAFGSHPRGQGFESLYVHKTKMSCRISAGHFLLVFCFNALS